MPHSSSPPGLSLQVSVAAAMELLASRGTDSDSELIMIADTDFPDSGNSRRSGSTAPVCKWVKCLNTVTNRKSTLADNQTVNPTR